MSSTHNYTDELHELREDMKSIKEDVTKLQVDVGSLSTELHSEIKHIKDRCDSVCDMRLWAILILGTPAGIWATIKIFQTLA